MERHIEDIQHGKINVTGKWPVGVSSAQRVMMDDSMAEVHLYGPCKKFEYLLREHTAVTNV